MKLADDFRLQATKHSIREWPIRRCSMCNYHLAYTFQCGLVYFDSGCDCRPGPPTLSIRTWQDVADHYNIQQDAGVIAQYDAFWHFGEQA